MSEAILCAYCNSQHMEKTSQRGIFKCKECGCLTDRSDQAANFWSGVIGKAVGTIVLGGIGAFILPELHDHISDHVSDAISDVIDNSSDNV